MREKNLSSFLAIPFYPWIAREIGGGRTTSIEAAIFYQQICYWADRTQQEDGFFYKTIEEFEEETTLSRYQQDNARRLLVKKKWIEIEKRRSPSGSPTLFYRPIIKVEMIARDVAVRGQSTAKKTRKTNGNVRIQKREKLTIPFVRNLQMETSVSDKTSYTEITSKITTDIPPIVLPEILPSGGPSEGPKPILDPVNQSDHGLAAGAVGDGDLASDVRAHAPSDLASDVRAHAPSDLASDVRAHAPSDLASDVRATVKDTEIDIFAIPGARMELNPRADALDHMALDNGDEPEGETFGDKKAYTKEQLEHFMAVRVIKDFSEINPMAVSLFGNKTQRDASVSLYKTINADDPNRLRKLLRLFKKHRGDKYAPTINSPLDLKNKYALVEQFLLKKREEERGGYNPKTGHFGVAVEQPIRIKSNNPFYVPPPESDDYFSPSV